jgi:hypothetical protein
MRKQTFLIIIATMLFSTATMAADWLWTERIHDSWHPTQNEESLPAQSYRIPNSVSKHWRVSYIEGDLAEHAVAIYQVKAWVPVERHPASYYEEKPIYAPWHKWIFPKNKYEY